MVPRRLKEPLEPSAALVDASDRFRACPLLPGVDVDDLHKQLADELVILLIMRVR